MGKTESENYAKNCKPEGLTEPWYKAAFDEDYLHRYAHRDGSEAMKAVRLFAETARLRAGLRVLDLCCGAGRHLTHLQALKLDVIGGDLSLPLLRQASELRVSLVRLDMRTLPFADKSFDAIGNFFTAFGYFETDEENFRTTDEAARLLKPAGQFFFDFMNRDSALRWVAESPHAQVNLNGEEWMVRRWISNCGRFVCKESKNERRTINERVRLYSPHELRERLSQDFELAGEWGDYEKGEFTENSPRYISLWKRLG